MVWEFQCPIQDCEFVTRANEEDQVVQSAQDHVGDAHGNTPTREEVEESIVGPG